MAHHASSKKRIRQEAARRLRNRYYKKSTRSAIKDVREASDKATAEAKLPSVISMIDKLAKRNNIHKNKAANLKSGLMKLVAKLA
jgi:small subunit ribosomal protein S20